VSTARVGILPVCRSRELLRPRLERYAVGVWWPPRLGKGPAPVPEADSKSGAANEPERAPRTDREIDAEVLARSPVPYAERSAHGAGEVSGRPALPEVQAKLAGAIGSTRRRGRYDLDPGHAHRADDDRNRSPRILNAAGPLRVDYGKRALAELEMLDVASAELSVFFEAWRHVDRTERWLREDLVHFDAPERREAVRLVASIQSTRAGLEARWQERLEEATARMIAEMRARLDELDHAGGGAWELSLAYRAASAIESELTHGLPTRRQDPATKAADVLIARAREVASRLEKDFDHAAAVLRERLLEGRYTRREFWAEAERADDIAASEILERSFFRPAAHVDRATPLELGMVYYAPSPVGVVLDIARTLELVPGDHVYDLGSGLGCVTSALGWLTDARVTGVEFDPAYVARARDLAREAKLARVDYVHGDARTADYSDGTVFYLFNPFVGPTMTEVLAKLRSVASDHPITICTFNCAATFQREPWLEESARTPHGLVIFKSRLVNMAQRP
jgi:methylase of polypeptide subunit release factors